MRVGILSHMPMSLLYPQVVEFEDGSRALITDDDIENRSLVVETDKSETMIRRMLAKSGFGETVMEFSKPGQIGRGMVKRINDSQIHIKLFQHGNMIQLDGELEVSKAYVEHLTHGWIPAIQECANMVVRHFGGVKTFHKGYGKYVKKTLSKRLLSLPDPKSKTSVVAVVLVGAGIALAGAGLVKIAHDAQQQS